MPRLNTKLKRELVRGRWQFVAVAVTVMLGIGFFHGSLASYKNLSLSYDHTYRLLAFGDVWVRMAAAPDTLPGRLERLPGVTGAIGRVNQEVRVGLHDRPVSEVMGRLISLPTRGQPAINRVRVVDGSYFSPRGGREALLEASFAKAHGYRVGEYIYPSIAGEEIRFRVVGIVQSAEYIYSIQDEQYLVPTPNTFGVIFIPDRQAEALVGMGNTINEVCLTVSPGRRAGVARMVEPITDRYGGEEPVTRDEQPSNKLLMMDLDGYRQMAVVFPLLFLTATVLTTYTLMARIVQSQRVQIGVLRATGFSRRSILTHFLWMALSPALAGGVLGVGLGVLFAWTITRLYLSFINIPYMYFNARPDLAVMALIIAVAAGLIGAFLPAREAALLPPAVAMSQVAADASWTPFASRWLGFGLLARFKLPLRNLLRRPRRTAYTVLGIALGVSLTILSFAILDSVDQAMETFFEEIERYDLSASFDREQPGSVVSRIAGWPGVSAAEPTLAIPVEVRRGDVSHSTALTGLPRDGHLRHLTTQSGRRLIPDPGEVLLGSMLRTKLHVQKGDSVTLHYARNRREFKIIRTARVGPPITQPIGSTIYMRMGDVQRLFARRLGMPLNAASGVLLSTDPGRTQWLRRRLHRLPAVAAVQSRAETHAQIDELMRFSEAFTGILALFGVGLALAVVFTAVSINVLERTREIATLRTLGFGFGQVAWLISVENLLIAGAGALLGIPFGRWLDIQLINASQSESMSLEPVIYARTYLIALVSLVIITLLSQLPGLLHVRRMNLATATKEIAG